MIIPKDKKDIKIVFMGTPEFAADSLEELVKNGFNVVLAISQPDRKKGRGMKLIKTPVKVVAEKYGIEVYQPEKLKNNEEAYNKLKDIDADLFVVVAYGKILRKEYLDLPKYGAINVHGSLLPKYRGAAPIQFSIINGEKETGVTTMFMDEGMDTGDMLEVSKIEIDPEDTYETLHDKLKVVGAKCLIRTLDKYLDGTLERTKQGEDYTVATMISKEMCQLNFDNEAEKINNLVRGVNPFPCSYMILDDERRFKIFKTEVVKDFDPKYNDSKCGEIVISDKKLGVFVKAKDYLVKIVELQEQNGKRMNTLDYLKGKEIKIGAKVIW